MTKQELIDVLLDKKGKLEHEKWYDQENHHIECDEALLQYINDQEITDAFQTIDKWYA